MKCFPRAAREEDSKIHPNFRRILERCYPYWQTVGLERPVTLPPLDRATPILQRHERVSPPKPKDWPVGYLYSSHFSRGNAHDLLAGHRLKWNEPIRTKPARNHFDNGKSRDSSTLITACDLRPSKNVSQARLPRSRCANSRALTFTASNSCNFAALRA